MKLKTVKIWLKWYGTDAVEPKGGPIVTFPNSPDTDDGPRYLVISRKPEADSQN